MPRSAPARWPCCPPRPAAWPRRPGSWPGSPGQRAGQCGPCTHGLPALAEAFTQIAFARPHPDTLGWAGQLTQLLPGRGACHLPDGGAGLAASALRVFAKDLRWHAGHGPCPPAARAAREVP